MWLYFIDEALRATASDTIRCRLPQSFVWFVRSEGMLEVADDVRYRVGFKLRPITKPEFVAAIGILEVLADIRKRVAGEQCAAPPRRSVAWVKMIADLSSRSRQVIAGHVLKAAHELLCLEVQLYVSYWPGHTDLSVLSQWSRCWRKSVRAVVSTRRMCGSLRWSGVRGRGGGVDTGVGEGGAEDVVTGASKGEGGDVDTGVNSGGAR